MSGTAGGTTDQAPDRTGPGAGAAAAPDTPGGRLGRVLQGVALALGLLLMVGGFALIAADYRPYNVPTDSMEPTVRPGDTVLARNSDGSDIGRGDVVVFRDSEWGGALMIKRVVAVGGDTLVCCDARQRLTVNGTPVDEPYLARGYNGGAFTARVPQGRIFLLGDNRLGSLDSRVHLDRASGTVPAADVLGRVEGTAWPFARMGGIDRTAAFDPVGGSRASRPGPLVAAAWASVSGAVLVLVTAALGPAAAFLRRLRRSGP
ncbi:signal peptidase I [Peterkaempfera bronchialis]|uniref:Signal peptidase I n=1 Tax=Peterkaempfera bronchialis TaxID=2126346 RepID=A0A345T0X1_9ACTN|nr:signal peptidase I [Peterkaempfera bronchialis]AXI79626.1 signal peptidase I [Peterkaempfera bronchialis]